MTQAGTHLRSNKYNAPNISFYSGSLQNSAAQIRAAAGPRRLPLKIRMFSYETAPELFLVLIDFSSSENDFLQRWHLKMLQENLKRHFRYITAKLKRIV